LSNEDIITKEIESRDHYDFALRGEQNPVSSYAR